MKRRTFILFTLLAFMTKSFASGKNTNTFKVIKDVYNHLFPTTKNYYGASIFGAFEFLITISKHQSFDTTDLKFIINGAEKLLELDKNFLSLNSTQKEKVLREFENTNFGQNWLSTLLYYGFEAMLGDPIYKGNKDMTGWKNINHTAPTPTASYPFGKSHE